MRDLFSICVCGLLITGCANESAGPAVKETLVPATSTGAVALDSTQASNPTDPTGDTTMADNSTPTEFNKLTEFEEHVIVGKGTERAFVGEYTDTEDPGTYVCKRCNAPLYKSDHKFHSGCGWPAFDDEIEGAIVRHRDEDGYRVEIVCKNCDGHLGHVFEGENLTNKNIRHCVNSVSMTFVPDGEKRPPVVRLVGDKKSTTDAEK